MTDHPMLVVAVLVWLVGFVPGWCAGWAGRGSDSRAWHSGLVRQLTQTRTQLADALDQRDAALDERDHTRTWAHRMPPPPVPAVHMHLDAALPSCLAQHPTVRTPSQFSNAMPVLPAEEVPS